MDSLTRKERSELMSHVKSQNSKIELLVRSFLHQNGFRFRLHSRFLPGRPDIVLPRFHALVFVNGCFWHHHPDVTCKLARIPKSNIDFWNDKFAYNMNRDIKEKKELHALGWRVFCVWECQLGRNADKTLQRLANAIRNGIMENSYE